VGEGEKGGGGGEEGGEKKGDGRKMGGEREGEREGASFDPPTLLTPPFNFYQRPPEFTPQKNSERILQTKFVGRLMSPPYSSSSRIISVSSIS